MLIAIVIFTFAASTFVDYKLLIKSMDAREKAVYFTLIALSFGLVVPYSLYIHLPSPSDGIKAALDALFSLLR